jgi:hypothetical protein
MPRYCSTYCEHNAEKVCECPPCAFLRENGGIMHERGCALELPKPEQPKG